MSDDINFSKIAALCIGMSGADLANVLNEAAILSARLKKTQIEQVEIEEAINKI